MAFRINLHEKLTNDEGFQKVFLDMCRERIDILFDTCLWVYEPRNESGQRNLPFILRPKQTELVLKLDYHIDNGIDLAIEKSREEGCSETITKYFAGKWLLEPDTQLLIGSRKAELVDKGVEILGNCSKLTGFHKCLMHKVCYAIVNLPQWMKPNLNKTFMLLSNFDNNAAITGEATNANFGAGDRQRAIFIDEHGAMDYDIATSIIDVVSDVTNCMIVGSTHYSGISHPWCQLVQQKIQQIEVFRLEWWTNPDKNKGLYRSPEYDTIEITDIGHYRELCPEVFNSIAANQNVRLSTLYKECAGKSYEDTIRKLGLIADGGDSNEGGVRSPWYDKQCKRRSPRNIAQNLDILPAGSGNSVFDPKVLHQLTQRFIRPHDLHGEIELEYDSDDHVKDASFVEDKGRCRLKWWGSLIRGRPDQSHNYIVACDIALGVGSSNSVAKIIDVNTNEEVGAWVCPNTPPDKFGDIAVGLCKWCGGMSGVAYLIWEANGVGELFCKYVLRNGHHYFYIRRTEDTRLKKQKNANGWWSDNKSKEQLCHNLNSALRNYVQDSKRRSKVVIHCEETHKELTSYLYLDNGGIGPSSIKDDTSGARNRHGDRCIATALAVLALQYQKTTVVREVKEPEVDSAMWRFNRHKQRMMQEKTNVRFKTI